MNMHVQTIHFVIRALQLCRRGLLWASVCPSTASNACIVTKQTKVLPTFLYHMKGIEVHLVFWHEEWLVGTCPSTWNFRVKLTLSLQNGDFQSIFARSATAFRPSEKSSIITNRKSTTSFPMSLRWTAYVAPNLPPKGAQKRKYVWKCTSIEESMT